MATPFSLIQQELTQELSQFELLYKETLSSSSSSLELILRYFLKIKGKRLRPTITLLVARAIQGDALPLPEKVFVGSAMVELLHTASLIHDDIIDDAIKRRSQWSVNALWGNKVGVLFGDYILSKGLKIATKYKTYHFLELLSDAVTKISEGEITQISNIFSYRISYDDYYSVIRAKTAELFSLSTQLGALSTSEDSAIIESLKLFGMEFGIAFQIRDDILDYSKTTLLGKPSANDLKEGKMTLPLIYTLENLSFIERTNFILRLKMLSFRGTSSKELSSLFNIVTSNGGIEYSKTILSEHIDKAISCIKPLPESRYKELLINLSLSLKDI